MTSKKKLYSICIKRWYDHIFEDYYEDDSDFHEFGCGGTIWTGTKAEAERTVRKIKKENPYMEADIYISEVKDND